VTSAPPYADVRLPSVVVSGEPFDVGFGLGRHAAFALRDHVSQRLADGVAKWRGSTRVADLQAAAEARFPDLFSELKGIADGAGLDFQDIFLINVLADLPTEYPTSQSGCTTLLVPGSVERGELALIAHNEDASLTATTPWFIAHITPRRQPSFSCLCYAGKLPGTAFSINSAGLVQTINDVRLMDWQIGVPRVFVARAVLTCNSTEAAVRLIRNTVRSSGYHHGLGSATGGDLYSVEAPSTGVVAIALRSPTAHANHLLYEPHRTAAQYIVGGSHARQTLAEQRLVDARSSSLAAMRSSPLDGSTLLQCPSAENDWHKTIATAVFEISRTRVRWSFVGDNDQELVHGYTLPLSDPSA
jgi:hypothetical protein